MGNVNSLTDETVNRVIVSAYAKQDGTEAHAGKDYSSFRGSGGGCPVDHVNQIVPEIIENTI